MGEWREKARKLRKLVKLKNEAMFTDLDIQEISLLFSKEIKSKLDIFLKGRQQPS